MFAGFGITAREYGYDDYVGMDVKGKVVVVLRHEPKFFVKSGSGKQPKYTYHSHVVNKAINARNHGAIAMVLVNSGAQQDKDELIEFGKMAGPDDVGIPVVHAKRAVAEEWLKRAGESLTPLEAKIEASRAPASLLVQQDFRLSLQVDIERHQATVHNVLGYLPGRSKEYIIIALITTTSGTETIALSRRRRQVRFIRAPTTTRLERRDCWNSRGFSHSAALIWIGVFSSQLLQERRSGSWGRLNGSNNPLFPCRTR